MIVAYRVLADLVVVIHLTFIVFAVLGGLLALGWHWVRGLHLPAAGWAAFVELSGGICPLTPLENWFRVAAGEAAYRGDFVERYVMPIIYPAGLTPTGQAVLGVAVIGVNAAIYGFLWRRRTRA